MPQTDRVVCCPPVDIDCFATVVSAENQQVCKFPAVQIKGLVCMGDGTPDVAGKVPKVKCEALTLATTRKNLPADQQLFATNTGPRTSSMLSLWCDQGELCVLSAFANICLHACRGRIPVSR